MSKNQYKKDIWEKSLSIQKGKSDLRSSAMNILVGAIILLIILIFPFAHLLTKGETIPFWLWGIFSGDIATLIGSIFSPYILAFLDMWKIAEKRHNNLIEKIDKYNSENLKLGISYAANPTYKNGDQISAAILRIQNKESVKILELRAMFSYDHFFYNPETDKVGLYGVGEAPLYFIDGKTPVQIINIRPTDHKNLLISEIGNLRVNGKKEQAIIMGAENPLISSDLCKESIYQVKITLQGKLEGELKYKSYIHEDMFYAKPENNFITFLNELNGVIIKMPDELRQRGLKKVEYLESQN